jgi:methylenetetrahydrofolate reductase (NADPH)
MIKSRFRQLLDHNHFVVTAEIGPPKGANPSRFLEKAVVLKGYADAFNVTDNQTAVVRLSSIAGSCLLQQNGLEPIVQMACRDRNRIALQSDVLGASALDLTNMLFVTGDHQSMGNHPDSKGVFDIDSIQLIQIVSQLRDKGLFQNGEEIQFGRPDVFIGGVCNPFASPFWYRVERLEKKAQAGAQFIQTQSVFNVERFAQFMDEVCERDLSKRLHILAGITPIKSMKMLQRMKYHVPGVDIPDDVYHRLATAKDFEKESIDLSLEIIDEIRHLKGVSGIHVTALFWEGIIPNLIMDARLYPRPKID